MRKGRGQQWHRWGGLNCNIWGRPSRTGVFLRKPGVQFRFWWFHANVRSDVVSPGNTLAAEARSTKMGSTTPAPFFLSQYSDFFCLKMVVCHLHQPGKNTHLPKPKALLPGDKPRSGKAPRSVSVPPSAAFAPPPRGFWTAIRLWESTLGSSGACARGANTAANKFGILTFGHLRLRGASAEPGYQEPPQSLVT